MFDTFRDRVLNQQPDLDIRWPLFEPIMAGPAMVALENGNTAEEVCSLLSLQYPGMRIAPIAAGGGHHGGCDPAIRRECSKDAG